MISSCAIAGSFDPFTNGHEELVRQACAVFEHVLIVVAHNPGKTYTFVHPTERINMIQNILVDRLPDEAFQKVDVVSLGREQLLIPFLKRLGVTHLVRGVRNVTDYAYEVDMQQTNAFIDPTLKTLYFFTQGELSIVSSSKVKAFVGAPNWQSLIGKMVHPIVVNALESRFRRTVAV